MAGNAANFTLQSASRSFRWYHWAFGAGTAGAFNGIALYGMGNTYRWYYADDEEHVRRFSEKYGRPTEGHRLEMFAWMAPRWDATMGKVEKSGADVYRLDFLAPRVEGDVLDVACGTGRCIEVFRDSDESEKVKSYVGLDAVKPMLDIARSKLADLPFKARLVEADAHKLPFPDASFDTVVGSLCLCSVERPAEVLDEMARVCRPGGHILLIEPGVADFQPIRFGQAYLGLVPNAKHAWEVGWFDDLDPAALVRSCTKLEKAEVKTKAMGNWYLISAEPRVVCPPAAASIE